MSSAPSVALGAPPASLRGFPTLSPADTPSVLYRIFHHRHHRTGALNAPWHFTSVPPGGSRFDVPEPGGTCYWSDRRYGCWVEVFRGVGAVERSEVTRRRLFAATPPNLSLANTLDLGARAFGVTGELSTVVPYDLPQQWASALRTAGRDGLVARCRHDPSLTARNFAIFGPSGPASRRAGWRTRRTTLQADRQLAGELRQLGVKILAVPHVVPVTPPPVP